MSIFKIAPQLFLPYHPNDNVRSSIDNKDKVPQREPEMAGNAVSTNATVKNGQADVIETLEKFLGDIDDIISNLPNSSKEELKYIFAKCNDLWDPAKNELQRSAQLAKPIFVSNVTHKRGSGSPPVDFPHTQNLVNSVIKLRDAVQNNISMQKPSLAVKILGYCGAVLSALAAMALIVFLPALPIGLGLSAILFGAATGVGMIAQGLAFTHMLKCARDKANLGTAANGLNELIERAEQHYHLTGQTMELHNKHSTPQFFRVDATAATAEDETVIELLSHGSTGDIKNGNSANNIILRFLAAESSAAIIAFLSRGWTEEGPNKELVFSTHANERANKQIADDQLRFCKKVLSVSLDKNSVSGCDAETLIQLTDNNTAEETPSRIAAKQFVSQIFPMALTHTVLPAILSIDRADSQDLYFLSPFPSAVEVNFTTKNNKLTGASVYVKFCNDGEGVFEFFDGKNRCRPPPEVGISFAALVSFEDDNISVKSCAVDSNLAKYLADHEMPAFTEKDLFRPTGETNILPYASKAANSWTDTLAHHSGGASAARSKPPTADAVESFIERAIPLKYKGYHLLGPNSMEGLVAYATDHRDKFEAFPQPGSYQLNFAKIENKKKHLDADDRAVLVEFYLSDPSNLRQFDNALREMEHSSDKGKLGQFWTNGSLEEANARTNLSQSCLVAFVSIADGCFPDSPFEPKCKERGEYLKTLKSVPEIPSASSTASKTVVHRPIVGSAAGRQTNILSELTDSFPSALRKFESKFDAERKEEFVKFLTDSKLNPDELAGNLKSKFDREAKSAVGNIRTLFRQSVFPEVLAVGSEQTADGMIQRLKKMLIQPNDNKTKAIIMDALELMHSWKAELLRIKEFYKKGGVSR